MKYKSRRSAALWKYCIVAIAGLLLDLYLLMMSFSIQLTVLMKCFILQKKEKDNFMRVTTKTALLLDN